MKKTLTLIILCIISVFLSDCARKTTSAVATDPKVELEARVNAIKQKYTIAQINEGQIIYQNQCAKCHELPAPKAHSLKKWDRVLPEMIHKAALGDNDAGKVKAWVYTNM